MNNRSKLIWVAVAFNITILVLNLYFAQADGFFDITAPTDNRGLFLNSSDSGLFIEQNKTLLAVVFIPYAISFIIEAVLWVIAYSRAKRWWYSVIAIASVFLVGRLLVLYFFGYMFPNMLGKFGS